MSLPFLITSSAITPASRAEFRRSKLAPIAIGEGIAVALPERTPAGPSER